MASKLSSLEPADHTLARELPAPLRRQSHTNQHLPVSSLHHQNFSPSTSWRQLPPMSYLLKGKTPTPGRFRGF